MKRIVPLLFLLLAAAAPAATLSQAHYPGTWVATWTVVQGEQQVLTISQGLMAEFHRRHSDGQAQYLFSKKAEIVEDLLVFKFLDNTGQLESKLVLSGWETDTAQRLYGMLYLYSRGEQFNGFPVTFEKQ